MRTKVGLLLILSLILMAGLISFWNNGEPAMAGNDPRFPFRAESRIITSAKDYWNLLNDNSAKLHSVADQLTSVGQAPQFVTFAPSVWDKQFVMTTARGGVILSDFLKPVQIGTPLPNKELATLAKNLEFFREYQADYLAQSENLRTAFTPVNPPPDTLAPPGSPPSAEASTGSPPPSAPQSAPPTASPANNQATSLQWWLIAALTITTIMMVLSGRYARWASRQAVAYMTEVATEKSGLFTRIYKLEDEVAELKAQQAINPPADLPEPAPSTDRHLACRHELTTAQAEFNRRLTLEEENHLHVVTGLRVEIETMRGEFHQRLTNIENLVRQSTRNLSRAAGQAVNHHSHQRMVLQEELASFREILAVMQSAETPSITPPTETPTNGLEQISDQLDTILARLGAVENFQSYQVSDSTGTSLAVTNLQSRVQFIEQALAIPGMATVIKCIHNKEAPLNEIGPAALQLGETYVAVWHDEPQPDGPPKPRKRLVKMASLMAGRVKAQ